jgi:transposase
MTLDIFATYLPKLCDVLEARNLLPAIFTMDNHAAHLSMEIVEMCRKRGLILVGFPANSTDRVQPLDKTGFRCAASLFA